MSEKPYSEEEIPNGHYPLPQIDPALCNGCGLCLKVCPNHVLSIINGLAEIVAPERCTYTGLCEQACPQSAIQRLFEIIWPDEVDKE